MYLVLVGPPGVATKTTTMGIAEELLNRVNKGLAVSDPAFINFGPTSGSWVKIIEKMSKNFDGSMCIMSGEIGNLLSYDPMGAYDFYSRIFDNPIIYQHSTRGNADETIVLPNLNIIGCTNPDWININSGYILKGGFAARTIFIFEYQPRQVKMHYDDVSQSVEDLNKLKTDLAHDLKIIGQMRGEFTYESKELRDKVEAWYQKYKKENVAKAVETFSARKHIHLLRTSMLLSAAQSDDRIVRDSHIEGAKILIEDVEKKLTRGLSGIGRNQYSQELYDILDFIKKNEPVEIRPKNKLWAAFWQMFPDKTAFESIMETLKALDEIEEVDMGTAGKVVRMKKVK